MNVCDLSLLTAWPIANQTLNTILSFQENTPVKVRVENN